jgi:hypothetical protein
LKHAVKRQRGIQPKENIMALNKLDIGAEIGRGWKLFQPNMGLLIPAVLIGMLLSGFTLGLLSGPMMAGIFMIVQRLARNDPAKPQIGDLFKGFDVFAQSLLLVIIAVVGMFVLMMIPVIGQLAALLISAVLGWSMMLVADRKATAIDALKQVFSHIQTGAFTMPLLLAVVAWIISGLGALACGIGIFFTMPLAYCILGCAYETVFGSPPDCCCCTPPPAESTPPPPADVAP